MERSETGGSPPIVPGFRSASSGLRAKSGLVMAEHPSEDSLRFYAQLGLCINAWAIIDRAFFDVCERVLQTDEKRTSVIYYRWQNFSQRVAMVDELVGIQLTDTKLGDTNKLKKQWKEVMDGIEKHIGFRNLIAHHPIRGVATFTLSFDHDEATNIVSYQPEKNISKGWLELHTEEKELLRGKKEEKIVKIEDLNQHLLEVSGILRNITQFIHDLKAVL